MIGGEVALENGQQSAGERDGLIRVGVVRTGDLSTTATIEFGVTNDGAINGISGDYQLAPSADVSLTGPLAGVLTLQPGQSRGEIAFTINDDAASESTETFVVSIINVDGTTLTAPRTTRVDILDDENPVTDPPEPPLESPYEVTLDSVIAGLVQPISFEYSPVNPSIMLVAEKRGTIKSFDLSPLETGGDPIELGTILDAQAITNNRQDRGLMDIQIHPDVENFPYLYAFIVIDPPAEVDPITGEVLQEGVDAFSGNAGSNGGGNRFSHLIRYELDESTGYTTIIDGSAEVILGGGAQFLSDISGDGAIDSTSPSSLDTVAAVPTDVADFSNIADPVFLDDVVKVDSRSHAGGALAFGPDGALYVSTGDGTSFNFADPRSFYVQDVDSLAGKILRIDPVTGEGLSDNPFYEIGDDLSANRSKVFQLGLRNPFSMGFDEDGDLLITDTGWNSWEEINSGGPGANFGWPFFEGGDNGVLVLNNQYANRPEVQDGTFAIPPEIEITPAFRAFAHANGQPGFQVQAITGGDAFYTGDKYPAALQGAYFFADVSQGEVFAVNADDRRDLTFLIKREGGLAPVHFGQGPDGYVYYADLAFGTIGRLQISEPVAEIALEPLIDVSEADQDPSTSDETVTPYTFTATLSSPIAGLVTVDYTAALGAFSTSGTLTFDPDDPDPLSSSVTIELPADSQVNPDQTLNVTLSNIVVDDGIDPARVAFAGGVGTLVETAAVLEDDAPRLSVFAPADVSEGDTDARVLVFEVVLTEPAGPGGVSANVDVTGGDGFAPSVIVISEGDTSASVTVNFTGDTEIELDETVTVTLSNVTNALEGTLSTSARILNDDLPPFNLVGDASFDLATGEYNLTIEAPNQTGAVASLDRIDLSQSAIIAFDINLGSNNGGADGAAFVLHNAPAGSDAIGASGGGLGAIGLPNAIAIEFDTYQNGGGEPANDHTGFFDPDGSFGSPPLDLGDIEDGIWRSVEVTWNPVGGSLSTGVLSYSIDGAAAGTLESDIITDYLGGSQFAHFAFTAGTGGLSNIQKVRLNGLDVVYEGSATPPLLSVSGPADVAEGSAGETGTLTFIASLDQASQTGDVVASVAITGDAAGPALVTIPQGDTSAEIVLNFNGDALVEPDETITVTLSDLQNADPGATLTASATILDDDTVNLTLIAPPDAAEGSEGETGTLTFVASLDQPAGIGGVTASISVEGGDGVTPSSLLIPESSTSADIVVNFDGDDAVEADETVTVTLSNLQNATADSLSASAVILNDDTAPSTVLSEEDFETGASGWSNNGVTDGGEELSTFLGRLDGSGVGAEKTFLPPLGTERLVIEFDYLEIDSWDGDQGDAMLVTVDGSEIIRKALYHVGRAGQSGEDAATAGTTNGVQWSVTPLTNGLENLAFGGQSYASDQIHRVVLTIEDPTGPVTLGVGSTLNQGLADESYGLDNVRVTAFNGPVEPDLPFLTLAAPSDAPEGDEGETGTLTFIASLDQASQTGDVVASVAITGDAAGPALVTIPQGDTSAEIVLNFNGDALVEPDETITVTLSDLQNADPGATLTASATILDDDTPTPKGAQLQIGRVTVEQPTGDDWFAVTFDAPIEDAVVIMGPVTDNGGQPAFAQIRNVTSAGFEYQIDEWSYLDGYHVAETMGWAAMSAGEYELPDGRAVIAGNTSASTSFSSVELAGLSGTPIVLAQPTGNVGPEPAVIRIRNVSETGFEVKLREEEAADNQRDAEAIGFIAIESGSSADLIVANTPDLVTQNAFAIALDDTTADDFVFLAAMQTNDGNDTAALRYATTATGIDVFVDEEQSRDSETNHTNEVVGYLAGEVGVVSLAPLEPELLF